MGFIAPPTGQNFHRRPHITVLSAVHFFLGSFAAISVKFGPRSRAVCMNNGYLP